jgi:hypothetical protein
MDASSAALGIHGHDGDKNRVYSIGCHGCPDSPKMGIHEGIHGGKATVLPDTPSAGWNSTRLPKNSEWIT